MIANEKHRADAARVFLDIMRDAPCEGIDGEACWSAKVSGEIIAAALANAEREGMKRAAEIARGCASHLQELALDLKQSGDDLGARLATNEARVASGIAGTILSEAGEG